MATARTALQGLLTNITPGGGWSSYTPPVKAGIGWPSSEQIQDVVKGGYSLVSVYDAGDGARDATRWAGPTYGMVPVAAPTPGLLAAVSAGTLGPNGGSVTITLSGTPNVNDAVVFAAQPAALVAALLANATAVAGSTLDTLATALATSINAADLYGITASATGAVVTVEASAATPLCLVAANTGNVGQRAMEVKRMARHVRVILWAMSEANRETVGNAIDLAIGVLANTGGFYLSSSPLGDWVSVQKPHDMYVEEQLHDLYRWDFSVVLEYGTLNLETLYPVLGTSLAFTVDLP